jgi:hypothetical protein
MPSERDICDLPLPPQPIIAIRSTGHDPSEEPLTPGPDTPKPSVSLLRTPSSGTARSSERSGRWRDHAGQLRNHPAAAAILRCPARAPRPRPFPLAGRHALGTAASSSRIRGPARVIDICGHPQKRLSGGCFSGWAHKCRDDSDPYAGTVTQTAPIQLCAMAWEETGNASAGRSTSSRMRSRIAAQRAAWTAARRPGQPSGLSSAVLCVG